MRSIDKDDCPGIGEVVKKPEMPKPNVHVGNGVWKRPDGKFETIIAPPPAPSIWDLYRISTPTTGTKP